MGKVIVPKNHISSGTTNYTSNISSTNVVLNTNTDPTYIYTDGSIIMDETINYTPTSGIIYTTSNVSYRINLFHIDSMSDENNEVKFIKLTLNNFPSYSSNKSGTNVVLLSGSINIYKYPDSTSPDCAINLSPNTVLDINGTYWLTFNTSTKKYSVTSTPNVEPLLVYKAIVPNKDNWMDFDSATYYSPAISTQMIINIGDSCNQPYIGRMINIEKYSSSNITISSNATYNLTINTEDKILGIKNINLGNFIGKQYALGATPTFSQLTFNIFVNNNSTAVYSKVITIEGYTSGSTPVIYGIAAYKLYIDIKNNKIITEDELSKAIDTF